MVKKSKITKKEIRDRVGIILVSFFTFYLVEPIKDWFNTTFLSSVNPVFIGLLGLAFTLYIFDF